MLYFGGFDHITNRRKVNMAGCNKVRYISHLLSSRGVPVEILSNSATAAQKLPAQKEQVEEGIVAYYLPAAPRSKHKVLRALRYMKLRIQIFAMLMKRTKRGEPMLMYHADGYYGTVRLAKWLKRFKLILEVEELYSVIKRKSEKKHRREMKFIQKADGYLFVSQLLEQLCNKKHKPYVISHGVYGAEKQLCAPQEDEKIHLVYAGTFNPAKGGPWAAVRAAAFLPDKYRMHILGAASAKQIAHLHKLIDSISEESKCRVTYDGVWHGEDFARVLQSCHIGLSTQNPVGAYNDTSFPSKILTYMANGLRVVSVRIPAVEHSDVHGLITYYNEQKPEEIAKAILSVDVEAPYDSRAEIKKLEDRLASELTEMITSLQKH